MTQEVYAAQEEPVKLLWTGGWDSTFRLLQLAVFERRAVRPFYLIDLGRRSTKLEILAMERIREHLLADYPDLKGRIFPTRYAEVAGLSLNTSISGAYWRVVSRNFIGEQYDWLSRWRAANDIRNVELCIHRDDELHKAIERYVAEFREDGRTVCRLDERFADTDEFLLFRHFSFPLFNLTKLDMLTTARAHGLGSYMEMTWFCHNPSSGATPCGICNPCRYAIEEGLGYRVPLLGRGKYHVQRFFVKTLKHRAFFLYSLGRIVAKKIGWA